MFVVAAVVTMYNAQHQFSREISLADELGSTSSGPSSILVLKCGYLWDDSPESDRYIFCYKSCNIFSLMHKFRYILKTDVVSLLDSVLLWSVS